MVERNANIGEAQIRVQIVMVAIANAADDLEARRAGRDDERRHPRAKRGFRIGDRHDDEEGRKACVRGEPLLAVDAPFASHSRRAGGENLGICATLRLRHRKARDDLVVQERLKIGLLLRRGPVMRKDFGVARIRRLTTEHGRPES